MEIDHEDSEGTLRRIRLSGRMDITGTDSVAPRSSALAASAQRRVVVDLTAVEFLASIGIRALISNAKALQKRGGKMVLLVGSNSPVARTLAATGIEAIVPVLADAAEADRATLA